MTLPRKPVLITILTIAGIVFGFIYLLKSCLAKYDERFIKTPVLVFKKADKTVVFSLVEFQKTTSYSQKGGMTSKSVNTQYYVQSNDGISADLIDSRKIKGHRQVKNFPVEIIGASGDWAWTFIGEPMAFDAFTLELKADIKILEEKNPSLKGRFPAERKFYDFNQQDNNLYFTATDGTKWKLDSRSLLATASDYKKGASALETKIAALVSESKKIDIAIDSLWEQKSHRPSMAYSAKQISYQAYNASAQEYYTGRTALQKIKDSIDKIKNELGQEERENQDTERAIESLRRYSGSFSQTKVNQDTVSVIQGGLYSEAPKLVDTWYGLYSEDEITKLRDRVDLQTTYDETARRVLVTGKYDLSKFSYYVIDKPSIKNSSTTSFLDGGLLLNKETAMPIRIPGAAPTAFSFLVVHKDVVGNEGKILLSNVNTEGKIQWTYNTQLTQWSDWILKGGYLYVFGANNKKLSSSESNIVICINLANGKATMYDYFKEKLISQ